MGSTMGLLGPFGRRNDPKYKLVGPPPCSSSRIGIQEGPNTVTIIPYSHNYWVRVHLKNKECPARPHVFGHLMLYVVQGKLYNLLGRPVTLAAHDSE